MTKTKDNGETMTIESEKKLRKTPVPQQYDRILAGALKMNIAQRAAMITALNDANKAELELKKLEFEEAQKLVGNGAAA